MEDVGLRHGEADQCSGDITRGSLYGVRGYAGVHGQVHKESIVKEADVEHLAVAIARALQQARSVSDSEHYDHHVWISNQIERDRERKVFWQKMNEHAAKWGMISVLSFGFYALWLGIRHILRVQGAS